jgi:hypothetical protein
MRRDGKAGRLVWPADETRKLEVTAKSGPGAENQEQKWGGSI